MNTKSTEAKRLGRIVLLRYYRDKHEKIKTCYQIHIYTYLVYEKMFELFSVFKQPL